MSFVETLTARIVELETVWLRSDANTMTRDLARQQLRPMRRALKRAQARAAAKRAQR